MKVCISLLLIVLWVNPFSAQISNEEVRARYDTATIRAIGSNRFMLKNKKLKKKELKALLLKYPESAQMYRSYVNKNRTAIALMFSSIATYAAGFILLPQENQIAGYLVLGGVAISISSIPVSLAAQYDLNLAVWLYNRATLTGSKQLQTQL